MLCLEERRLHDQTRLLKVKDFIFPLYIYEKENSTSVLHECELKYSKVNIQHYGTRVQTKPRCEEPHKSLSLRPGKLQKKKSKIEREKHLLIPLVTGQVQNRNLIKFSFDMGLINQHV